MIKKRSCSNYLLIALSIVYLGFCPLLTSISAQNTEQPRESNIHLENGEADALRTKILRMIARGDSLSAARGFAQADSLCNAALIVSDSSFGSNDTLSARCLDCRVTALRNMQQLADALPLAQRSLAIREKTLGDQHPDIADNLYDLGALYYFSGRYEDVKPLWEKALAIREKTLGSEHPDVAESLHSLGVLGYTLGNYPVAKSHYEKALAVWEKALSPDSQEIGKCLNNLANVVLLLGDHQTARAYFDRALNIWERTLGPEHPNVAVCLDNLANLAMIEGNYRNARSLWERALNIRENALAAGHPVIAQSLSNLAVAFYKQGDYDTARPLWERSLTMLEIKLGPEHPELAMILTNLGTIFFDIGDLTNARFYWQRALSIRESAFGPDHPDVAQSLLNLSALYYLNRDIGSAKTLVERALAIWEKTQGPEHPNVASSRMNLGQLLKEQGDYAGAERQYERARDIWSKSLGSDHPDIAYTVVGMSQLFFDQEKYERAELFMKSAMDLRARSLGSEHPKTTNCQEELCRYALFHKDVEVSWEMASNAFLTRRQQLERIYAISSERQALLYSEKVRGALDLIASTADLMGGSAAPDSVRSFIATAILQTKAQILDEISARQNMGKSGDADLAAMEDSLTAARALIAGLYTRGPGDNELEEYLPKLKAAIAEKEKWELKLASKSSQYRAARAERNAAFSSVAASLPEGSVLVEFFRYLHFPARPGEVPAHTEERDLACVLTKDASEGPMLLYLGSSAETDSLIQKYRQHIDEITRKGTFPDANDEKAYREVAGALYRRIWSPVEEAVKGAELVFIAPDASLNLICFGGLPIEDGRFLLERHSVQYLSTGRDLIRLRSQHGAGRGLLAFGDAYFDASAEQRAGNSETESSPSIADATSVMRNTRAGCERLDEIMVVPLPASGREVRELCEIFEEETNEPASRYLQVEALEDHLKAEVGGKRIVHLATHAYYLQGDCADASERKGSRAVLGEDKVIGENPLLLSGLLFAGANLHGEGASELSLDDGILTAEEICSLDLTGAEWVVLSACETGLGELKKGEGVFGLRRAFQLAGAHTVIMSLWPVGDRPTREFMVDLYRRRLAGVSTAASVREASLFQLSELREQRKPVHPFTWAAFIALGDWR